MQKNVSELKMSYSGKFKRFLGVEKLFPPNKQYKSLVGPSPMKHGRMERESSLFYLTFTCIWDSSQSLESVYNTIIVVVFFYFLLAGNAFNCKKEKGISYLNSFWMLALLSFHTGTTNP